MPASFAVRPLRVLAVLLLACMAALPAWAADMYDGVTPRAFTRGEPLAAGSTIGGYPIYQESQQWRVLNVLKPITNSMGVAYGTVILSQQVDQQFFAEMVVSANLNQVGGDFYLTSDSCGGQFLFKVNKATVGRGDAAWDNCLTIGTHVAEIARKRLTLLDVRVTNSLGGGRYYRVNVLIDPARMGFADTLESDWTTSALASDPARKLFADQLLAWATQLQSAVESAVQWRKPADAFGKVVSLRSLMVVPSVPPVPRASAVNTAKAPSAERTGDD